MANKEIRSKFIQEAMNDANQLVASMQDVVDESVRSFLGAGVKEQLKQVINEGTEDEFEIEEVPDTEENPEAPADGGDNGDAPENGEGDGDQNENPEGGDNADGGDGGENPEAPADGGEDAGEDDAIWNEIESYRNEDGEYDLSKCEDGDCVARVLKVLTDEDGVRVAQNDNGTLTLTDDNTEQEYIIDLGEGGEAPVSEGAVNLGYGPKQNKTAMTTPSNNEPANSSTTYPMDAGAPTGTENPIGHEGDKAPFDNTVTESDDTVEIEIDEGPMSTGEQNATHRGPSPSHTNSNPKSSVGRSAHAAGEQKTGSGESSYKPMGESYTRQQVEAIMKRATAIFNENKQLRAAVAEIKENQKQLEDINGKLKLRLQEASVAFTNMGYMAKCMVENAMTTEEKRQMMQVLSKPKTTDESKRVYEAFTHRLRQTARPAINLGNAQAAQLSESRNLNGGGQQQPLNEGTGMQESLSLIERMNSVYGY